CAVSPVFCFQVGFDGDSINYRVNCGIRKFIHRVPKFKTKKCFLLRGRYVPGSFRCYRLIGDWTITAGLCGIITVIPRFASAILIHNKTAINTHWRQLWKTSYLIYLYTHWQKLALEEIRARMDRSLQIRSIPGMQKGRSRLLQSRQMKR